MTILQPAPVSTRQFFYDASNAEFVGEASSTNGFGRVYDDACDEGLTLISARTGVAVTFVIDQTHRNEEGEVLYWRLVPVATSKGEIPFVYVRLFND